MAAHSLKINRAKLHAVGMRRAKSLVTSVTRRTFNRSQVLTPVDTGNLRASGQMSVDVQAAQVVGTILYTAEYAAAVHEGRRALTIRAKRPGGKLKFTVGGRTVYATQVHQPARAGRPFLANALREVAGDVQDFRVTIG
jgi:hypothetical protein